MRMILRAYPSTHHVHFSCLMHRENTGVAVTCEKNSIISKTNYFTSWNYDLHVKKCNTYLLGLL